MNRLLFKLTFFLPILALMALVNWHIDPGRLFSHAMDDTEQRIANILHSGKNVELFNDNFDERLLQRIHVEQLTDEPQVLILGSSRGMQINSSQFPGENFFNACVTGAVLQDYVAIYQLYYEKGLIPERLILEINPWSFNRDTRQFRWRTLIEEYRRGMKRLDLYRDHWKPVPGHFGLRKNLELLSPKYFQSAIHLILLHRIDTGVINATTEIQAWNPIRFADGSREYEAKRRNRTPDEVRTIAIQYVENAHLRPIGRFRSIDDEYSRLLECFVDDLRMQGVEVVLYLPPYHPASYKMLMANPRYKIIGEVEDYIRRVADERGIEVSGSYDPELCDLDEIDFVDGLHTTRGALAKFLISPPSD